MSIFIVVKLKFHTSKLTNYLIKKSIKNFGRVYFFGGGGGSIRGWGGLLNFAEPKWGFYLRGGGGGIRGGGG